MTARSPALLAAVLTISACASPPPEPAPDVVAVYEGGQVMRADVERMILTLPEQSRRPADGDWESWYEAMARELATRQILVAEARREDFDERQDFLRQVDEAKRRAVVAELLRASGLRLEATVEEIEAYYRDHLEGFRVAEQREVYHLFLRPQPGEARQALEERMEEVRRRLLEGESFTELAKAISDSELRHRDGFLGWVHRGQLPGQLEEILFQLEVNVPSDVTLTADGAHLFLVTEAIDRRLYELEEVRSEARAGARNDLAGEAIRRLVADQNPPEGAVRLDDLEIRDLVQANEGASIVLAMGDWAITVADLRERLLDQVGGGARVDLGAIVDGLWLRELAYRRAVAEGLAERSQVVRQLEAAEQGLLLEVYRREKIGRLARQKSDELRDYYDARRRRYASLLELDLVRLTVPLSEEPGRRMARLERFVEALNSGSVSKEEVAAVLEGRLEELDRTTLAGLGLLSPLGAQLVADVAVGRYSPPFRVREGLVVFGVRERVEPRPLAYQDVEDRVRREYVEQHGQDLNVEMSRRLLKGKMFKIAPSEG